MSWIDRMMIACVRFYLAVVFVAVVALFAALRRMTGKSPIRISRRHAPTTCWVARPKADTESLIVSHRRGRSLLARSARTFLREKKYDHALTLVLLLPVKAFLRVDKSIEVDPSIYVMY